jgi:HK97 gp10 family phage protein
MAVTVRYFAGAERIIAAGPDMRDAMQRLVSGIAGDARAGAPVDTPKSRGGARTITGWVQLGPTGWEGYVGWARRAYYLRFHEKGTEVMPARPFLRPAIDRRRIT